MGYATVPNMLKAFYPLKVALFYIFPTKQHSSGVEI